MDPFVPKDQAEIASNAKVRDLVAGSNIGYAHLVGEPTISSRGERLKAKWRALKFKQFIKRDKWWFSLTVLSLLFWMTSWYPMFFLPPLAANTILLAGLSMMLYAGPESRARWLIFLVTAALYVTIAGLTISSLTFWFRYSNPVVLGYQWRRYNANEYYGYYH